MAGESDKAARARIGKEQAESYVKGLENELVGYERSGNTDRADQVKAEIARVSGKKAPASSRAKGRASRKGGKETTDATQPAAETTSGGDE